MYIYTLRSLSSLSFKGEGIPARILKTEYQKEIQKLVTDRGIWYDTTTFFIRVRK